MTIENISDTARWVAVYRAMETERPDALFKDSYARKLAGEKGQSIVNELKGGSRGAWTIVVRTCVIDEYILSCVREKGVDLVLNLAAGLDTRPLRLDLPPDLRWIEVDLPPIMAYKEAALKGEKPRCRFERIPLDLSDGPGRRELFARLASESRCVLVLTEGFLMYLKKPDVVSLAQDLAAQENFRFWIQDFISPGLQKLIQKNIGKTLQRGNSEMHFAVEEGPAFYSRYGWGVLQLRYMMDESRRLKREMPGVWIYRILSRFMSAARKERYRRMNGFVLLERSGHPGPR